MGVTIQQQRPPLYLLTSIGLVFTELVEPVLVL